MSLRDGRLVCYKEIELTHNNKINFFVQKHSTKEGTWGLLTIESGELEFIFLDGEGKELSCTYLNETNNQIQIPPAAWHKVKPISKAFFARLKFFCLPHRYFPNKYKRGNVHSDLLYVFNNYIHTKDKLNILDVGCGKGRNVLYAALLGHHVTGIDIKQDSIDSLCEIVKQEQMENVRTLLHDLNQPLPVNDCFYDFIISTVSLQFLKKERIPSLLRELQTLTKPGGLHLLVFPIKESLFTFPESFTYLSEKKALYHFYQDSGWAALEYSESVGQLHRLDESGKPIQGLFGLLLAQKNR
jgi:tellurite methyltransferase